jgi:plastocyanin
MKTAIVIVIALIVIAGGYLLLSKKQPVANPVTQGGTSAPLETTNPNPGVIDTGIAPPGETSGTGNAPAAGKTVTVTYNGTSFSPSTVTIKKGDTVRFVDSGASPMWVASNPHPVHSGYSGTSVSQHCPDTAGAAFDECEAGTSYSFTFQKTGSWGYHNHANHAATGTVVVTP